MNRSFLKSALPALVVAFALGTNALATPITGDISISGSLNLNNTSLGSATAVTSFNSALVTGTSGTYAVVPFGTSVTYTPFTFVPTTVPVSPLWTFTLGPTYSFDLLTMAVSTHNNQDLVLHGTGWLNVTGFDQTEGIWRFSINDADGAPNATFAFGFTSNTASVPDGGTTALLLGFGLTGLAILARFRKIA